MPFATPNRAGASSSSVSKGIVAMRVCRSLSGQLKVLHIGANSSYTDTNLFGEKFPGICAFLLNHMAPVHLPASGGGGENSYVFHAWMRALEWQKRIYNTLALVEHVKRKYKIRKGRVTARCMG